MANYAITPANTNEYIRTDGTGSLNVTSAFSAFFWIKPANNGNYHILMSKDPLSGGSNRFFYFQRLNTKNIRLVLLKSDGNYILTGSGLVASSGTIEDGTWYFVGFTYSQTNGAKLYINGSNDGSLGYGSGSLSPNNGYGLAIGGTISGTQSSCGTIDELVFFNRELSAAEVTTLYGSGNGLYGNPAIAPFNSGLQLGYHFDEGTGTTLADFSGASAGATIYNNASPTWSAGKVSQATRFMSTNKGWM